MAAAQATSVTIAAFLPGLAARAGSGNRIPAYTRPPATGSKPMASQILAAPP
jgi:hypothetical protein